MRILGAVGLAVMLLASGAGAKQTNKPDLKLTASLDMAAPEQQPILVIHMLNQSGHVLRIPDPPLLCKSCPGCVFAGGKVRRREFQPVAASHRLRPRSGWQWVAGHSGAGQEVDNVEGGSGL